MEHLWAELYADATNIELNTWGCVYRMVLSMLLGSVVGYERKRKGQTAGVRTFSLIAMGATLAMILSIYVPQEYLGLKNGDPGRIAAQVVTGVGFLGAGAIIQMKGSVRGLTTAAGIWMVATIGMAVGMGMYTLSIISTGLIIFVLIWLERIENRISRGSESRIIRIRTSSIVKDITPYRHVLASHKIVLTKFFVDYDYDQNVTHLNLVVLVRETTDYIALFGELREVQPTRAISLANQINI